MAPSRAALVRRFGCLDAAGYARLLAAVARAREGEARAEGTTVVYGDGRRVRTHAPSRGLPASLAARVEADGVDSVAPTRPAVAARLRERGVAVVAPAAVARRLLYGLSRRRADALAREHLGGPLDAPAPRSVRERVGRTTPALGVLVVAVAVALVAVAGAGDGSGRGAAADVTTAAPPDTDEPEGSGANETLAPGVTASGVADTDTLADAHEAALGERYEVDLDYREEYRRQRSFPRAGRYRTVAVAGPARYYERTRGWGDPAVAPIPTERRAVYGDGEYRYIRGPGENATVADGLIWWPDTDSYASRSEMYIERFLDARQTDVVETRVEDGQALHRVAVRGSADADVAAYSATAVVTDEGLVRELQVSYLRSDEEVAVSLLVRYDPTAGAVERPSWVPADTTNGSTEQPGGRSPDRAVRPAA
jgi:hypothetical protein